MRKWLDLFEEKIVRTFKVIKPHEDEDATGFPAIFLAGSIDQGKATDWQQTVQDSVKDLPVTIYNPRRDVWMPDLKQDISEPEFAYQVNWELDHIANSNIVFFYFSPTGPAPISLMELGYVCNLPNNVIVCCPEGYWRKGNVQVICFRNNIPVFDTLDEAIKCLKETVASYE